MKSEPPLSTLIATGLAMFSMFFGAGNVVFPLAVGQETENMNLYATLGLLVTAIGVPFLGLWAMTLFDGNYQSFFGRIGKRVGFVVALIIMGLIGPFGAIPRCITLSYSTIKLFLPGTSLYLFSLLSCLIILALTYHRRNLIDILGFILTPLLLGSLALIIGMGVYFGPPLMESSFTPIGAFRFGLAEGYQTMDLLGAFFFSSIIVVSLKKSFPEEATSNLKELTKLVLKSSVIGASLLALAYIGFIKVAAYHSALLHTFPKDELISKIALEVLGPYAGLVACIAVALACLTTAIALATVFGEFLHEDIAQQKLSYQWCLIITLIFTYIVSTFEFSGIAKILVPILSTCYPALIVMSLMNILYKLYGITPIKLPVLLVFLFTLAIQLR